MSKKIKRQGAILLLKVEDGSKNLLELLEEQETGVVSPGRGGICTFSIQNSHGGGSVIITPPPGQTTEFEFMVGPGGSFSAPETDSPKATLGQIFVRTDSITKAMFVWEFC